MRLASVLSLLIAVSGCSAVVGDDNGEDADGADSTVHGAVLVERLESLPSAPSLKSTHVSAHFLRISGGLNAATAEQLVGSPALDADAQPGCAWRDGGGPTAVAAEGSIELLDVGEIVLHVLSGATESSGWAPGSVLPLAARAFPDVGDLVSGVVYTSRDGSSELPAGHTYLIETSGSALIDGFSIQVEAPAAPQGVKLGSVTLDHAEVSHVSPGEPLAIAWDAGNMAAGDRIYVDVAPLDDDRAAGWRCVFEDNGHGVVPAAFTRFASGSELDVAIHRLRRTTVNLPGDAESAVVDFDFAVAARATME